DGRARRPVEKSAAHDVSAKESPERADGDLPRPGTTPLREESLRRALAITFHLRQAVRKRRPRLVQDRALEALDRPVDEELLVDRPRRVVPAARFPEEPHVAIGPQPAVPEPDAAEVVLERQRVRAGASSLRPGSSLGELRRGALVGIDGEDPFAAGLRARELVLAREVVERARYDAGAESRRHLTAGVARAAVDHQHLVAEASDRLDAGADSLRLVLRHHRGGERHDSSRMRAITSVVECSFPSPAMAVRPPSRATRSRSGTDSSV